MSPPLSLSSHSLSPLAMPPLSPPPSFTLPLSYAVLPQYSPPPSLSSVTPPSHSPMQVTCGPVSSVRGKRGVASHLHRTLRSRLQRAGRSLSALSRSATATHYVLVDVEIRVPYEERLASPEKTYRVRIAAYRVRIVSVSWRHPVSIVEVSCQYRGGIVDVSCTYRDVLWRYRVRIVTYSVRIAAYCRGIGYVL